MEVKLFLEMLNDKHFPDYNEMKYKYPGDFSAFLSTLEALFYKKLPLSDCNNESLVYFESGRAVMKNTAKLLLRAQNKGYGIKAAEDEIIFSSMIESIDFSRDSVRNILKGLAPDGEEENRILGQKKGIEFISDIQNKITEESIYELYMMTVGSFLKGDDRLKEGCFYRHDSVYIVSDRLEHVGADSKKVPLLMKELINFINADDEIDDLIKAAIIHFYFAYIHPYFDGNGRMARLLHLWYLVQRGYKSVLFVPFSSEIMKSKKAYYNAFTLVEKNALLSGKTDVTPFIVYFVKEIYNKITESTIISDEVFSVYNKALFGGEITEKEKDLWSFVVSVYCEDKFSTKQLEKDFGNAAYATIRGFVLKFERLGLLCSEKYGTRVKYKINI